ncbi:12850_t:CDS:2, partial [Cetraspora pellucida]
MLAQSNNLLRRLNAKLLVEIAELKKENAKIKAENTKLKQDKEDIEARFVKLEQSDKKKTDLIAKLEWDVSQIKQASTQSIISPEVNSNNISEQIDNTSENVLNSMYANLFIQSLICQKIKRRTIFLDRIEKERVSNMIRERNQEKLQKKHSLESKIHQNSDLSLNNQNASLTELEKPMPFPLLYNANTSVISSKNDFTSLDISGPDKISKSCIQNIIPGSVQSLSYLFDKAVKKGQKEILYWYYYLLEFENKEIKSFLSNITDVNLHKKIQRAQKILILFGREGVSIAKIKQISYSACTISGLTNVQIQYIINYMISKTVTNGHDQILISEVYPTHNCTYFCNKILEQYPNLYKDNNSKNVDYYEITDETLCSLCELDHDDDEDIE